MMFLLVLLSMMCTFLSSKSLSIRCRKTCRLRGVPCFLSQGKGVHVVLRWGECPEEVKMCGMNTTHAPSLVPIFVPQSSAHYVVFGSCSHVSVFLFFTGAAVVSFCNFEAMAPEVPVLLYGCYVSGSSWACGGEVGSGSSFCKF